MFTPPATFPQVRSPHPQDNCKVPKRRRQIHVLGRPFPSKMRLLAEKWTSPRTLQFSWPHPLPAGGLAGRIQSEYERRVDEPPEGEGLCGGILPRVYHAKEPKR